MATEYKFTELSVVTDEALEEVVNRWGREGWTLESIYFAMRDSSRRPSMAFVAFVRERAEEGG
jgi:hypothetical protein